MNDSHMLPLQQSFSSGALLKGFYCMVSLSLQVLKKKNYPSMFWGCGNGTTWTLHI